jgi:DNA-binding transcriptional LysR family regulator
MLHEIDLARADLNLLVLFEAVLHARHVGRAGERLHLSPSAVSHGLGRLRRAFNDPLFLKHPKGVVPTALAEQLAEPIAHILEQARAVFASGDAFDPLRSTRTFTLGAPDGIAAVTLPAVVAAVERAAPNVRLGLRELQPSETLAALDARQVDLALYPLEETPARFEARQLYEEDFVIAARRGHRLGRRPTLDRYAQARHVLVTRTGDRRGFVDDLLAKHGLSRTVALTVPTFMAALAAICDSDLVAALPRSLVEKQGARFGVVAAEPPVRIGHSRIKAIATRPAMTDAGIAWLMSVVERVLGSRAAAPAAKRNVRRQAQG